MRLARFMLTLAMLPAPARAEAPKFEFGKADDVKDVKTVVWTAQAQGGLVVTTGNADTITLSAGGSASRKDPCNKVQLEVAAAYTTADLLIASDANGDGMVQESEIQDSEITTSKSWLVKGRYDRFFTARNSAFGVARVAGDEPAGKQLIAGGQVGYSRLVLKRERHELAAELGYDFTYEDYVATGDPVSIHSARVFAGYAGKLGVTTALDGSLELLVNLNEEDTPTGVVAPGEDVRLTGKLALTSKIASSVSLRFGFTALYDRAPAPLPPFPVPYAAGFTPIAEQLDTRTELAVIVNFL